MTGRISKIERQKKNPHRYAVYIEGEYAFGVDEEILFRKKLTVDLELSERDIDDLLRDDEHARARTKAFELLSYRDHSVQELSVKLRKRGFKRETVAWVIEAIGRLKLLDDETFAHTFARGKIRQKPMGRRGMALQLKQKGISDAILDKTLDSIYSEFDEQALARELAAAKLATLKDDNPVSLKKKLHDFLYRRGFAWETIEPILSDLQSAESISSLRS